ncbi:toxin ParE1/3/4 [Mucilaginibacter sp. UYNi724]
MGLIIVYSFIAKHDLNQIYKYIRRDSFYYAQKEVKEIRAAIRGLKINSFIGKKFEKADNDLTRELIFKNYRVIYDIEPNKQIVILSIHHHSRHISNNPAFKSDE